MIRPATPDDAPALGAIWNRVIRETTSIFNATERGEAEIAEIIGKGPRQIRVAREPLRDLRSTAPELVTAG